MDKIKIQEIASEAGASNATLIEKAKELGFDVKAANSTLSVEQAGILMDYVMSGMKPKVIPQAETSSAVVKKKSIVASSKNSKVVKRPKIGITVTSKIVKTPTIVPVVPVEPKEQEVAKIEVEEIKVEELVSKVEVPVVETPVVAPIVQEPKVEVAVEPKVEEVAKVEEVVATPVRRVPKKRLNITIVKKEDVEKSRVNIVRVEPKVVIKRDDAKVKVAKKIPTLVAKKVTPKKMTVSRESGTKMLLDDRDFGGTDSFSVFDTNEIVLLDFSDKNIYDEMMRKEQKQKEANKKKDGTAPNVWHNNAPAKRRGGARKRKKYTTASATEKISTIKIPENVRVYEFAEKTGRSVGEVIKVLFTCGLMFTQNDFLDKDAIEFLADEFEVEVMTIDPLDELDYVKSYDEIEDEELEERPPVITIMGHVDHGKTSLLDKIRKTKVADREDGGITQHVGAYQVEKKGKKITFIDTPGHSAFTEMRARGAQATDIVIIVVAADDGVMEQTKEALSHAKAAGVPIIVAVNKIDKENANPEHVKAQLAEEGITPVEWGGEHEFIHVSARTGEGIEDLLDTILIQAEIMELTADANRNAKAVVLESSVQKGFGSIANIIVKNGTLRVGDSVLVGTIYGKVRTLILDDGKQVKSIAPGTPAAVAGLSGTPSAGEIMVVMDSEKEAREIATKRAEYARVQQLSLSTKVSLHNLSSVIAEGNLKSISVIVKADVQGSLEAIRGELLSLKNDEVKVNIIHEGIGDISESDVALAGASAGTLILGFNAKPNTTVKNKAKDLGVDIRLYSILYALIDDMKLALGGLMSPVISEKITGSAEVREIYTVAKVGTIGGCKVISGSIFRNSGARVIRNGDVIYTGKLASLKRFNDDAREVKNGFECGIMLDGFNDILQNDIIETFQEVQSDAVL